VQQNEPKNNEEVKESQAEAMIRLVSQIPGVTFFHNEVNEAFVAFEREDKPGTLKVRSHEFKLMMTELYFDETGKAPSSEGINQALGVLEMMSLRRGEQRQLELRVAKEEGRFFYDLGDPTWQAVKISADGVAIVDRPPLVFNRTKSIAAQVKPDFSGRLSLLRNHFSLANESDWLLLLIYIISCFIPGIPHPILVVSGEKGAAKSTMIRMIRSIVDPSPRAIVTMPTSIKDLALNLANSYMPSYDNLDSLSAQKSDLLCTAATGGGFPKRMLYTDSEEIIVQFLRCVTLNGISVVASRSDLLDRSIVIQLQRIEDEMRKEEREVWEAFERDKPLILGGALRVLSGAMKIYPDVKLPKLFRMADFTRWGYAIAEAAEVEGGGEAFLQAYEANIERANTEAIEAHPVAAAVIALMERLEVKQQTRKWVGSVSELLDTLERVTITERINTRNKLWPKGAHVLSKRLAEVKSNLEKRGILFDIRNAGHSKEVTIEKVKHSARSFVSQDDSLFSESD
jgi:hypothetical protein